jgi:YbgC/YbaW family acyl-CoA thioester hydrolase
MECLRRGECLKTYCRIHYRIPFSETDAMGIVHHSNHPKYLERGRIEFLRLVGTSYKDLTLQGIHFPVLELQIKYKKPLLFDDIITIETKISFLTKTRLNFSYKIYRGSELIPGSIHESELEAELLCVAESFHCSVNEKGRPIEMNTNILKKLESLHSEK